MAATMAEQAARRTTCPQCRRLRFIPHFTEPYCTPGCKREAEAGWPAGRLPGPWLPGRPAQARAQVPVKAPGGVPVKVMKTVYRGAIHRRIEARPGHESDYCPHSHLKQSAAKACGERAARRANRAELHRIKAEAASHA